MLVLLMFAWTFLLILYLGDAHALGPRHLPAPPVGQFQAGPKVQQLPAPNNRDEHCFRMPTLRQPERLERHHLREGRCDVHQSHRWYIRSLWTINLMIFFILATSMSILYMKESISQKKSILEAIGVVWVNILKLLFRKTPVLVCHQRTLKFQACTVVINIPSMYSQYAVMQISRQNQASLKVHIHYAWKYEIQSTIFFPVLLINIILCNLYDTYLYSIYRTVYLKIECNRYILIMLPYLNAWIFIMSIVLNCFSYVFTGSNQLTFLYYQDGYIICIFICVIFVFVCVYVFFIVQGIWHINNHKTNHQESHTHTHTPHTYAPQTQNLTIPRKWKTRKKSRRMQITEKLHHEHMFLQR